MTRRQGLIASVIATVILFFAMSPAENRMTDTGGPGMVPFELSGGQHRADEILAEWGEDGQDASREQLWIDSGFLVTYGTFLTFALTTALDLARKQGWHRSPSSRRPASTLIAVLATRLRGATAARAS